MITFDFARSRLGCPTLLLIKLILIAILIVARAGLPRRILFGHVLRASLTLIFPLILVGPFLALLLSLLSLSLLLGLRLAGLARLSLLLLIRFVSHEITPC